MAGTSIWPVNNRWFFSHSWGGIYQPWPFSPNACGHTRTICRTIGAVTSALSFINSGIGCAGRAGLSSGATLSVILWSVKGHQIFEETKVVIIKCANGYVLEWSTAKEGMQHRISGELATSGTEIFKTINQVVRAAKSRLSY